MSFITEHVAIRFLNFFGFLSVKFNTINNSLEISRLQIIVKVSKIIFLTSVVLLAEMSSWFAGKSFENAQSKIQKQPTAFAEKITKITEMSFEIVAISNLTLQVMKCRNITKFINDARKLPLNDINLNKFLKIASTNCFALAIYWALNCSMIFVIFISANHVFAYVYFIIIIHLNAAGLVSVFVIKCIENYLVAHLVQINNDFNNPFNGEHLENLFKKFLKIAKLFEDFEYAFGYQWTLSTSSLTMYITLYVCLNTS